MNRPENNILVIFGASGDLTKRKLIPGLFALEIQNLLPDNFAILGASRSKKSDDEFRKLMRDSLKKYSNSTDSKRVDIFLKKICYQSVDAKDPNDYPNLLERLQKLRKELR